MPDNKELNITEKKETVSARKGKRTDNNTDAVPVCKKNDELVLDIEDLGTEGEGIGKIQGYTLFVKDALVGDKVRVKIMKTKKSYAYARLLEIIEPSGWRTEPACPVARQCGGCQLQHCSYEKQLEWKRKKINDCLKRIGGFGNIEAEPVIGMEEPYYYRNKAQFPVGYSKDGSIITGFYAGRTHSIIPFKHCLLQNPCNSNILDVITRFMDENNISAYNEAAHKGVVRHIITRTAQATGEVMVCLVINADKLPAAGRLVQMLLDCDITEYKDTKEAEEIKEVIWNREVKDIKEVNGLKGIYGKRLVNSEKPFIKSICININKDKTNVILGGKTKVIYGTPYITDYIGDVKYHISPVSFYQVNHSQTEKLYNKVMEFADLKGNEIVWDLYCGIGTISLFLAQKAAKVCGVEIVPQAVEDARENALLNNLDNVEFFSGAAEEVVPLQYEKSGGRLKADVVTLDPPRKGCDEKLLQTIAEMQPARIVYVSCDPATLARDLKYLCGKGYEVEKVQPVDMFCQSYHVETVVQLSHKKPDSVINVKAEFGEGEGKVPLDNIAKRAAAYKPKERVTYKMIKEYIEAKYGFKVHTAYIAEVKRELGLPMYDAPNAVEELKQPRKHPTPEKVEAIKDALKHFEIM
ncbi:MAG: 23S rRNA (uracil(1939)-C(5))-methyltransferase RlmD [Lachnospiraceae bacterium]|nr:23S rRNA (uracil(1939)-C(5))-methyltransferase RlmD [Lachnospiraceae bacterium]